MTCTASRHGHYSAYRQGCRCPDAREDWRLYHKRRRQGRAVPLLIDATGTHRRIQALQALGWPRRHLEPAAGLQAGRLSQILRATVVTRTTATAIAHIFDQLCMTPGPSAVTRHRAAVKDWPPPLAWDDDTIDDPAAEPQHNARSHINAATERAVERAVEVERLTAACLSAAEIGDRLGVAARTVVRDRGRMAVAS